MSPIRENQPSDTELRTSRKRVFGVAAVLGPITSLLPYLDYAFLLEDVVQLFATIVSAINLAVWATLLNKWLGLPAISTVDGVFLSFLFFLTVALASCWTKDRAPSHIRGVPALVISLAGVALIVALFAIGDIATFDLWVGGGQTYGGIQKFLFDLYLTHLDYSRELKAALPRCVARISSVYIFYAVSMIAYFAVAGLVMSVAVKLILPWYRFSQGAFALRIWQIVGGLVFVLVASTAGLYLRGVPIETVVKVCQ